MRLVLTLAVLLLAGCPSKTLEQPSPVGAVPEVVRKDDFVAAHNAAIRVILTELRGVQLSPAAARLLERAELHSEAIGAAVPPPSEPARKAVEAVRELPVVLEEAAKLLREQQSALNDKARKQHAKEVLDAKKQARVDALCEVFTWLATLAGLVHGAALLAAAASAFVPLLVPARRALLCGAAVAALLGIEFVSAALLLNHPWVFILLGVTTAATVAGGAFYWWRLPSPKAAPCS